MSTTPARKRGDGNDDDHDNDKNHQHDHDNHQHDHDNHQHDHHASEDAKVMAYECLLNASRPHLKRLLGELMQRAPPQLLRSLLNSAVRIGAWSHHRSKAERWQNHLQHDLLDSVFVFLQDYEKLSIAERICRRWYAASRREGAGWREWQVSNLLGHDKNAEHLVRLARSDRCTVTRGLDVSCRSAPTLLPHLKHLRVLILRGKITNRQVPLFKCLDDLTLVVHLNVVHCVGPVQEILQYVNPQLTDLQIRPDALSGNGMRLLSRFPHLTRLLAYFANSERGWTQSDLEVLLEQPCCCQTQIQIQPQTREIAAAPAALRWLSCEISCCDPATIRKLVFAETLLLTVENPTDATCEALRDLPNLVWLQLYGPSGRLTDRGLQSLVATLPRLSSLVLNWIDTITDAGIAHLRRLHLELLDITACGNVTGETFHQLDRVHTLELERLKLSDVALQHLTRLPRLKRLVVHKVITATLPTVPQVKQITVNGIIMNITDDCVLERLLQHFAKQEVSLLRGASIT